MNVNAVNEQTPVQSYAWLVSRFVSVAVVDSVVHYSVRNVLEDNAFTGVDNFVARLQHYFFVASA